MPNPGSTTARGYGAEHQALRREWAPVVAAGDAYCAAVECTDPHGVGRWIPPDAPWDLGHTADRTAITGPEHRRCNRRDGAVRRNAGHRRGTPTTHAPTGGLPTTEDWWQ